MNLSRSWVFVLLMFVFWSFTGFAQSGEPEKEKPKTPDVKESVKNVNDKKADDKKTGSKTNQSTSTPSNDNVETLEVTGSYIRRSDIEGPSPIVVFDREQIENSGFDSVGSFLSRHTAVLPFGSGYEGEGGIRGLGSVRTLVLVNGQRVPGNADSYAIEGASVASTSIIPLAAVERVEILKDGASATYGSDALGGVINIITRKNWDGMAVLAKLNVTDYKGGDSLRTSMAYGKTSSRGNFLTSFQYAHGTKARRSDLERIAYFTDIRPMFSTNYQIKGEDKVRPGPGCNRFYNGPPLSDKVDWQGACLDHLDSQYVDGPYHGFNWVTDAEYEVFDDIKLYSTLYVGYETLKRKRYESFLSPPFKGKALPSWKAPGLSPGTELTLFHRLTELPDREEDENFLSTGLIVGAKGYLFNDWIWDVTVNNQLNRGENPQYNTALIAPVTEALKNGTYNPFGDPSQNDTEGFTRKANMWNRYQVNWLDMKASGSLGDFLGIDWASAFGVSAAHFEYQDERDEAVIKGEYHSFTGTRGEGERQLYAVFAEFNGVWRNVEGQLSLRYDTYSDFGSTFNPKIAFRYQALNWLTLRTSFGTGFKAPTLHEAYGSKRNYFANNEIDYRYCKDKGLDGAKCVAYGFQGVHGANPNLKEETSRSFNFGMILQPLENLFFSLDYWNVTVDGAIGSDPQGILRAEAINPDAPKKYGVEVKRKKDGTIEFLDASLQNLGKEQAHGLDFNGTFKMIDPFFKGSLILSTDFTYMFSYRKGFYEELGMEEVLGRQTTPRWKNVSSLTYSLGSYSGTFTSRSTPKVEKQNRLGFTPDFTQFDLSTSYKAPWGGSFQLGAINVFKQQPEYDFSNRYRVYTPLYSAERTFFLAYRQDF